MIMIISEVLTSLLTKFDILSLNSIISDKFTVNSVFP